LILPHRWKLLGVAWLLATACSRPAHLRYEEQLDRTPESAAHAVHEQRLRELMGSLDRLRSERLPKSLDLEVEQERQTRAIAQVARAMAESATQIPQSIPTQLDDRERAEFLGLASALRRQTDILVEQAPELTREQRLTRLDEIDATCDHCHRRFRIPGLNDDAL
jgi:hypothetical protein